MCYKFVSSFDLCYETKRLFVVIETKVICGKKSSITLESMNDIPFNVMVYVRR